MPIASDSRINRNLFAGNQRKRRAGPIKRACIPAGISEISGHLTIAWKMTSTASASGNVNVTTPGMACEAGCRRPKKYSQSGAMLPTTMAEITKPQRRNGSTAAGCANVKGTERL